MAELEKYIREYFGVADEELAVISGLFKPSKLNKGDYFLKAGQYGDKLSFIKNGLFRIYAYKDDKEITQWIASPGYFITELGSLIFNQPARFYIQALTDAELYTIYKDDYNSLSQLVPKWPQLEKCFIAKCFIMLEDRVFTHLSMSAEERYRLLFEQNKELFNQVPLQFIASMLGMTPETFSRIRAKHLQL